MASYYQRGGASKEPYTDAKSYLSALLNREQSSSMGVSELALIFDSL